MIEKIKKTTIFILKKDTELFLKELRNLGIIHIKTIGKNESEQSAEIITSIADIKQAQSILLAYPTNNKQNLGITPDFSENLYTQIIEQEQNLNQYQVELSDLNKQLNFYSEWGAFNPQDIVELNQKGFQTYLYKVPLSAISLLPEYLLINQNNKFAYIISFSVLEEFVLEELPALTTEEINTKILQLNLNIKETQNWLKALKSHFPLFKNQLSRLENKLEFLNVLKGMENEETFEYLQGYCPNKDTSKLILCCNKFQAGYLLEDPAEDEEVPTLISNPKWIQIIKPLLDFMDVLPGYKEHDISMLLLIFFSIFFAMLIGDAGYGILFLIATFILRKKMKNLPDEPFFLLYLLSSATVIWGSITGTWFAYEPFSQLPFLNKLIVPSLYSYSDSSGDVVMKLCFIIGAIHLTLARSVRGFRIINSMKVFAEIGWIMVIWSMYFFAKLFVLNIPLPNFVIPLIATGMILILIFTNFQKNILKGIGSYAMSFPLDVISSFSDVVSYIRLFAVGFASLAVAQSFNNLTHGIVAPFIIFAGHSLNIVLGFMAVIVHGVRLNMLEFSGHLGMQWTGQKFKPFKETIPESQSVVQV